MPKVDLFSLLLKKFLKLFFLHSSKVHDLESLDKLCLHNDSYYVITVILTIKVYEFSEDFCDKQ